MKPITLKFSDQEKLLIENYAKANNITIPELIRQAVLEKIESDVDLAMYKQIMRKHKESPEDISFDEMMVDLELDR